MNETEHPEPQRVLQLFTWESQAAWQKVTPLARLHWLDFIIHACWAGAAHRQLTAKNKDRSNP